MQKAGREKRPDAGVQCVPSWMIRPPPASKNEAGIRIGMENRNTQNVPQVYSAASSRFSNAPSASSQPFFSNPSAASSSSFYNCKD
jgi:hypothetical protein